MFGKRLLLCVLLSTQVMGESQSIPFTAKQRVEDVEWMFSKIQNNYAPLQYKLSKFGINFEELRARAIQDASQDMSNAAFYRSLQKSISIFQDTHLQLSAIKGPLHGLGNMIYTGIQTERYRNDTLIVTGHLPIIGDRSRYPIKKNDIIVKVNGTPVKEWIMNRMGGLSGHSNKLTQWSELARVAFQFSDYDFAPPIKSEVALEIVRNQEKLNSEIIVPWVVTPFYEYARQYREAALTEAYDRDRPEWAGEQYALLSSLLHNASKNGLFQLGQVRSLLIESSDEELSADFFQKLAQLNPTQTFSSVRALGPETLYDLLLERARYQRLKKAGRSNWRSRFKGRFVPISGAIPIPSSKLFPGYIYRHKSRVGNAATFAYLRVPTFSLSPSRALSELKETVRMLHDLRVSKLIIDVMDNGGGVLQLPRSMSSLFSSKSTKAPSAQYGITESWFTTFFASSLNPSVELNYREYARRAFKQLQRDAVLGRRVSAPLSLDFYNPNGKRGSDMMSDHEFQILILANEMCVSSCDVFLYHMQQLSEVRILGNQSAGAAGNIVLHGRAPNSGFIMGITESMFLDSEGESLENNGIKPNFPFDVSIYSSIDYSPIMIHAFNMIVDHDRHWKNLNQTKN